jgi:hypothetical protein
MLAAERSGDLPIAGDMQRDDIDPLSCNRSGDFAPAVPEQAEPPSPQKRTKLCEMGGFLTARNGVTDASSRGAGWG